MLVEEKNKQDIVRKLPSNISAEQMLLGAIIINSDLLERVNEFLRPEHFFEKLHQKIYNAIEILAEKGLTTTHVTIHSMLEQDPLYIEAGGNEYIIKLTTIAMVVINPYDYGKVIYDLALKRNLISIGEEIVNNAYSSTLEEEAVKQIESAEHMLYTLASEGLNEKNFKQIRHSLSISLDNINKAMKHPNHLIGISTGLIDLDKKLLGFQNSDLIILAGRPSMGKTAFAINFAFNACKHLQQENKNSNEPPKSIGFFSLEMSADQLSSRLLAMLTKIDSVALKSGDLKEPDYNNIRNASEQLAEMQFFIDDTPSLSISAIRSRARKLKRKHNLGILFIDYLQLITSNSKKATNRVIEVSEITQGLKSIAKELNIPVIALAQLSRAVDQREDKRPVLSDLRESGSIEQDADIVMFIYREEYYLRRSQPSMGNEKHADWQKKMNEVENTTEVIVAKHRNGSIGNVTLSYLDKYSSIGNYAKNLPYKK